MSKSDRSAPSNPGPVSAAYYQARHRATREAKWVAGVVMLPVAVAVVSPWILNTPFEGMVDGAIRLAMAWAIWEFGILLLVPPIRWVRHEHHLQRQD